MARSHIAAFMTPSLVVLAAGRSTRYGKPKQLDPVGPQGEWLLDYTIDHARRAGFGKVVVVASEDETSTFEDQLVSRHQKFPIAVVAQQGAGAREKPRGSAGGCHVGQSGASLRSATKAPSNSTPTRSP